MGCTSHAKQYEHCARERYPSIPGSDCTSGPVANNAVRLNEMAYMATDDVHATLCFRDLVLTLFVGHPLLHISEWPALPLRICGNCCQCKCQAVPSGRQHSDSNSPPALQQHPQRSCHQKQQVPCNCSGSSAAQSHPALHCLPQLAGKP